MKGRKTNGNSKGRKNNEPNIGTVANPRDEARFFRNEARGTPARLRRRLTSCQTSAAASGLTFAYAVTSGSVTTATEWAALSPNYQQYRVRAIQVTLVPRNFNNMGFAATVWYPGSIVGARYPTGSSGVTLAAVFAEGGSKVFTCSEKCDKMVMMTTAADNPDAALFTDCNLGAPPSLSQFGIQYFGSTTAPAIYNLVVTHDAYVEYDVEFISRN
jgi:hypothetical protein